MSSIFSSVETLSIPRSKFKIPWTLRTTYKAGPLYPCFAMDCSPSDTIRIDMQSMIKLQPMVAPSMTPERMDVHFFFVPYRLLDDNFEEGYTGIYIKDRDGHKKGESFDYQFPLWHPTSDDLKIGSLWDYFCLPINVTEWREAEGDNPNVEVLDTFVDGVEPTAYLRRAYNLVYNTMFRDENYCDEVDLDSIALQHRAWRPDYFTKALPDRFKPTNLNLALPINTSITGLGDVPFSVTTNGTDVTSSYTQIHIRGSGANNYTPNVVAKSPSGNFFVGHRTQQDVGLGGVDVYSNNDKGIIFTNGGYGSNDSVKVGNFPVGTSNYNQVEGQPGYGILSLGASSVANRLSAQSTSLGLAELRDSFQLMKEAERSMRTGSRFEEYIFGHFGERVGNSTIQLPEYIGGFKTPILIGDSLQTSASEQGKTAQGNRIGVGDAVGSNHCRPYHVVEPGLIIGIASILPQAEYMQGMPKEFIKHDRLDFLRHEFCCLSEREVMQGELVCCGDRDDSESVPTTEQKKKYNTKPIGFQGIYNEYRVRQNQTSGQMRSIYQFWHRTRVFNPNFTVDSDTGEVVPNSTINKDFIEASNISNRVFANFDDDFDQYMVIHHFVVRAWRPITRTAIPGLIDHF